MKQTNTEYDETPLLRKQESLAQQVTQSILLLIQTGKYLPGDKLPSENDLAQKYGISRTIIREALASLKNDDILESKQGKGILVKDPQNRKAFRLRDVFATISITEVSHLYEMRAILEAEAATLATMRLTEENRILIMEGLNALTIAVKENASGEKAHDLFNAAIASASLNPMLIEFLSFLQNKLRSLSKELRLSTMMSSERAKLVLQEHEKIVEAIFSKDPLKARTAVLDHLQSAAKRAGFTIYSL